MSAKDNKPNGPRLIPIPQFNDYHPDPSPAAIRWMIHTNKDGFLECVVRRGRRILIDEDAYYRWLRRLNPGWQ